MFDPNAVAVVHVSPKAADDGDRLIAALDEIAAALGLNEPPSVQMGYIVEFWGVTPQRLREVVAGIQTRWTGVLYFPPVK
jgi:hypothetical protein